MKKWWLVYSAFIIVFASCGIGSTLSRYPAEDKNVYEAIKKLEKRTDENTQKSFTSAYADAVLSHQNKITQYRNSNQTNKWERIMTEYGHLLKLAQTVNASQAAAKLVTTQNYQEQYAEAKKNAAESYYAKANDLLRTDDRYAAREAASLLKKTDDLIPGYKDVENLQNVAAEKGTVSVVINPVNYYSQSFGYWGLNNDYIQQEIARDLRYQLNSSNVKVYTEWEARRSNIVPDRVVDIGWDQLYIPTPITNTSTRQVSKQINTGRVDDKKQPIYETVTATLYITEKYVRANGNLTLRIFDAKNNRNVLWDNFPADYTWREHYATYRGDSRALSGYELAMINNSAYRDPSRNDIFGNVLREVYPRLVSRIRSVTW
ncbi:MAG TPA: hypothetical protein VF622_08205 [Segetibacter sp.]|jgi:hypothetical protein